MKRFSILICISVALLLPGCLDDFKEPKTVQWYTEHPDEREAMVAKCANNPGKYNNNPDCINAKQSKINNSASFMK